MAYKNFSLERIRDEFGIQNRRQVLTEFIDVLPLEPSDWLKETIQSYKLLPNRSEKAKSEAFVSPILLEMKRSNPDFITIHSGDMLNADPEHGLNGECDFIIGKETHSNTIDAPLFSVIEAKKGDLDLGKPQCAAQMLGVKIFNEKHNIFYDTVYGVVTTASSWLFLKLEDNIIYTDDDSVISLNELPKILGRLQYIIDFYKSKI
jgi:hypothetical protein